MFDSLAARVMSKTVIDDINDVVPAKPDYTGLGFIADPIKQVIGHALAVGQAGSLLVIVIALVLLLKADENKVSRYQRWLKRGLLVLVLTTVFNVLITGGMGFITGVFK